MTEPGNGEFRGETRAEFRHLYDLVERVDARLVRLEESNAADHKSMSAKLANMESWKAQLVAITSFVAFIITIVGRWIWDSFRKM